MSAKKVSAHEDPYIHQKKYANTMNKRGLRRVSVWVPDDDWETLVDTAAAMREKHRVKTGG